MVYSTLDIFTTIISSRGRVIHSKVGSRATTPPARHFSSCSNPVEQGTLEEGSCKKQKIEKFGQVAITTRVMSPLVMYLKISLWRYLGWNKYIYSTLDIFTMISLGTWPVKQLMLFQGCYFTLKLITLVVIATSQTHYFSRFLQLPSSSLAYSTRLEQLLKYQLGVWIAPPTTNFRLWVTSPSPNYTSVKISSVE